MNRFEMNKIQFRKRVKNRDFAKAMNEQSDQLKTKEMKCESIIIMKY